MARNKILILTSAHLCRNPRVVKEAAALGAAGHDVTVLNLSTTERFERLDLDLIRELPFQRATLDHRNRTVFGAGFRARCATWLARAILRRSHLESAAALGPARSLRACARAFPADLTILHNEIPLWAAQRLIADGRRVAADFEDWYSEDLSDDDRRHRPLALLRRAEDFALRRAAFVTAPSASMAAALTATYGGQAPVVVRNVFPLQSPARPDRPSTAEVPVFVWFSQTVGPGRGLELFFSAWNRTTSPSRVVLIGDEQIGFRERLLALVAPERRARVSFIPSVPPQTLPGRLAECDLGLALELSTPRNRDLTITNKIFQYLNAGLAVVATDTAGQREVMQAAPGSGLLVSTGDPAQFAAQLDRLLGQRGQLRACQQASRAAAVAEFCWEKEAPRLVAAVERALTP